MRPGNIVSTPGVPPAPVSLRQPHLQRGVDTRFEILKGPSQDSSNTTLVVENLPAGKDPPENLSSCRILTAGEHKNETDVREYFSQFGTLKEIIVNAPRGKALLVYEDHESALKAWNDPRPVFNNRFVKIFWKRTENVNPLGILPVGNGRPGSSGSEAKKEERDPEEVERELEAARAAAAKAQLQHEEKLRKKAELAKKKEELEQQRLELLERQRVEKERLLERIRKAQAAKATPTPTEEKKEEVPVVEKEGDGEVNGEKNGDGVEDEPDERKLKLQKMLNDLQSQVPSPVAGTRLTF
jgi:RNA-binding protein 26